MGSIRFISLMATHLLFPHLSIGFPGGLETKTNLAKTIPPPALWSWLVQIRVISLSSRTPKTCLGVIKTKNEIITPAHCLYVDERVVSESNAEVWVRFFNNNQTRGDMELEVTAGIKSIVHPEFVLQQGSMHDIAVLQIKQPLPPHTAPEIAITSPSPRHKGSVLVLRHGHQERISVSLWSFQNCLRYHPVSLETQICASDPLNSIRPGDSGSPLLCSTSDGLEQLCGIVSYGFEEVADYPQAVVYTNLSPYHSSANLTTEAKTGFGRWTRRDIIFAGFLFLLLAFLVFGLVVLLLNKGKRMHARLQEPVNDVLLH